VTHAKPSLPHRGTCPVCGQFLMCDDHSKLYPHISPPHEAIVWCPGSGQVCLEDQTARGQAGVKPLKRHPPNATCGCDRCEAAREVSTSQPGDGDFVVNQLRRRAMAMLPLTEGTVLSFYEGLHSWTVKQCLKALCESHERLRTELQGQTIVLEKTQQEVASVLLLMDGLAEQWGDEGVFRRCRDRLRKLLPELKEAKP
jgi:hypothetical protein